MLTNKRRRRRTRKAKSSRRRRNNPVLINKRRKRARRRRRNPAAMLYGVANPRRRKRARRARRARRTGGGRGLFGGLGVGNLQKLMQPAFLMQALGAGAGLVAAVVLPNWAFNKYPWYRDNGWVKQLVRAGTAVAVFPMFSRMLPGPIGTGFATGALAAVGVGALTELLGRPVILGPGATDVAATPQTLFSGVGAYVPKMIAGGGPFGAAISRGMTRPSFSGIASDLGMSAYNAVPGKDLVASLYSKEGYGF